MHAYSNSAVFLSSEMHLKRLPKEPTETDVYIHTYIQRHIWLKYWSFCSAFWLSDASEPSDGLVAIEAK